jgi:hypothetical protein
MKHTRPLNPVQAEDQKAALLTKAALDCARKLALGPHETAAAIGVPAGALTAMKKGERAVDGVNGEAECADALVRVVKRLNALLGADESRWRAWMRREVDALDGKPLDLVVQRHGVLKVAAYLDAARDLT